LRHAAIRAATTLTVLSALAAPAVSCARRASDPSATFRDGFVDVDSGLRLYYRTYGSGGRTLVLLHGGPGANFMGIGPDLLPLAAHDTLVMYDQRGGGRSDPDPAAAEQTFEDHVADLEAVRRHLGAERVTLVGHSWGCILGALYAHRFPEHVERLVLIAPMEPSLGLLARRMQTQKKFDEEAQTRLRELAERGDLGDDPRERCRARFEVIQAHYYHDPAKMADRRGDYCDAPPDASDRMAVITRAVGTSLGLYNLTPQLAELTMPALVVDGARSALPLDGDYAWARALPDARLWLIDDAGHAYPFVENPAVFFPGIQRFLEGEWPAGAEPQAPLPE